MIVTGGNGLLGKTFESIDNTLLHNRNILDLFDKNGCVDYFEENRKEHDTIIHLAAKVGGVNENMNNNEKFFNDNKLLNDNVIESAKLFDYKTVITMLSTCIFPDKVNYPLTPDQINNGKPHDSNYGYAYSKRLLGYQTEMYRNMTGNNWLSIIPTNLYGFNDNYNIESSHIIPGLIHKAYLSSINGDEFSVWGNGKSLRQFMFADDLRDITLWAKDNWKSDLPLMASDPIEHSIKDVVNIIGDRFNILDRVIYDETMPNGQYKKTASSDVPNWDFISLEEGINNTIDHFIKNYNTIRK